MPGNLRWSDGCEEISHGITPVIQVIGQTKESTL